MSDPKILFQNNYEEVIENKDRICIKQKNPSVLILPYILDASGSPKELGLVSEPSATKEDKMTITVISGSPEDKDIDILATAKRELLEESGYDVSDTDKWDFLGNIQTSKLIYNGNPAFGVNVTGLDREPKEGDGSEEEKDSKFELYPINDAINNDDALISCLFLKLFQNKLI
jgi:8-oxo-dGTP pyrophosphatase MutT (NUDIX family)